MRACACGQVLHSETGLLKLEQKGLLTAEELAILRDPGTPPGQRHNAVLAWISCRFTSAFDENVLKGDSGFEQEFLSSIKLLRAKMGTLPDERVDRMPLAYMHIVQILVDTLCVLAPLALYPKVGELCIPLCTILTLFYRGLLQLSKSFLDPFGNFGSKAQNINTDVFLAESNAGAPRWSQLGERVPA